MARTVSYRRGSASVDIPATPANESFSVDGETWDGRYFKVAVADLVLGGVPTVPLLGDRIVETTDAPAITYEVLAQPGGNHPPWQYVEDRLGFRVHTVNADT